MAHKLNSLLVLLLIILKETGLTAACSSSCSLSYCNCRDRGLNGVPQFLPINITYLSLYRNEITILRQFDFAKYKALETLNLMYNQISEISRKAFYNATTLRKIELDGNRLTSLQVHMFEGLDNLELLDLSGNRMNSIEAGTFSSTPKLRTLNLRSNRLTTIAADTFANLPQFSSLDLSGNSISTIKADTFFNLPQFGSLGLVNNGMNTFPVGLFSNLSTLSNLDIENNQIETLPPMAYDILASISTSNLGSNPWQCDCRMLPFKQRMTGSYLFEYTITCAGPGSFQGKALLQDVNPDDMICEETTASPSPSTSSPVVQPGVSTSLPLTSSKTSSTTHNTVSTPGLSTVSPSPSDIVGKSTSTVQQSSTPPMASVTHIADSTPYLSTVSDSSSSEPTESPQSSTSPRPNSASTASASTHVLPEMTESKPGPSLVWFSLPSFLNGLLGAAVLLAGLLVIRAIFFTIRCIHKRRTREAPSSQNSTVSFANTNLPAAITISGQAQTGQDRSSIATSTEGYSDVIPPFPPPPPTTEAGSQAGYQNVSAAAHGADANARHQYEALTR